MAVHPKEDLLIAHPRPQPQRRGQLPRRTRSRRTTAGCSTACWPSEIEDRHRADRRRGARSTSSCATTSTSWSPRTKSLMPEGFEKQLTAEELTDLLEFLDAARQVPAAAARQGRHGRQHAAACSTARTPTVERLVFPDWTPKTFDGVPFQLVDPQGDRVPNVILLLRPARRAPAEDAQVGQLPCNAPAKAIHLLSGVSGWGFPYGAEGLGVDDRAPALRRRQDRGPRAEERRALRRLHPPRRRARARKFAFALRGQQLRYLAVQPKRAGQNRARSSWSKEKTCACRW